MPRLQLAVLVALALFAGQGRAQQKISARSPDQKRVASADGKVVQIKDTDTGKVLLSIRAHRADVTALAYAPDGKTLASADKDGKVCLFDTATGRDLRSLKADAGTNKL